MRNFIFASVLLGLFAAATPARADTMNVTASIAPSITLTMGGAVAFGALTPAAANFYVTTQTFTLSTNTKVDVVINAALGDLDRAASANNPAGVLNTTFKWKRDAGVYSGIIGEGEVATSGTDAGVAAGSYTYTIEGTIKDAVTATTVRGSYASALTITATDLGA